MSRTARGYVDAPFIEAKSSRCALCELPLGLKGFSPALKVEEGKYVHTDCLTDAATKLAPLGYKAVLKRGA